MNKQRAREQKFECYLDFYTMIDLKKKNPFYAICIIFHANVNSRKKRGHLGSIMETDIGSLRTSLRNGAAYSSVRKENSIETNFNRSYCNVYSPIVKLIYS